MVVWTIEENMMTKLEIVTRAVELVYVRHGVHEHYMSESTTNAAEILSYAGSVNMIADILELGLEHHGLRGVENTLDDAVFINALVEAL
jgi:ribulose-5-phosphate 4-epimerase/fuculose-1-phosphate aldolase